MKKVLILGGLLMIATTAMPRMLNIVNATPFGVKVHIRYVGKSAVACKDDNEDIFAGDTLQVSSGICSIKEMWADVHEQAGGPVTVVGVPNEAVKYTSHYQGGGGSVYTNYHIYGPMINATKPAGQQTSYGISRTVD